MAREGDRNTSQDRRHGNNGPSGTRRWESTGSNKAPSKHQEKNPPNRVPAAKVPSAPNLKPSIAPWRQAAAAGNGGMQVLKTTDGISQQLPSQGSRTPTTAGGGATSWAALLGGGATPPATPKTAAKEKNTSPQPAPAPESNNPDAASSSSLPVSPRSFSFQRGNGVVLVHEAPQAAARDAAGAAVEHHAEKLTNQNAVVASSSAPSQPLSWAEKAKLAAAQAPPVAAATTPPRKQNMAAASAAVTSPRRGQGAPRSPGAGSKQQQKQQQSQRNQQQQQKSAGDPRRSLDGKRPQQQQHEKSKAVAHNAVHPHPQKAPDNDSAENVEAPQLLKVPASEPVPFLEEEKKKNDALQVEAAADEGEKCTYPIVVDECITEPKSSPTLSAPSEEMKEALDILCSSLASWRLPANTHNSSSKHHPSSSSSSLFQQIQRVQPRGIRNPGNLCFVNAILQGLMGTSSFCHVLLALRSLANSGEELLTKTYPVLSAMVNIAAEFQKLPTNVTVPDNKNNTDAKNKNLVMVLGGHPVSSALIMELINQFSPRQDYQQSNNENKRGEILQVEQEDAHEFLHFLLDKMDSELVALKKMVDKQKNGSSIEDNSRIESEDGGEVDLVDDDGWLVKSGKKAVRQQEVSAVGSNEAASVITALFQGKFATSVACAGAPNSVTVHPFMIVELPIYADSIRSISDSIDALTAAEVLEDYKPFAGARAQHAAKTERFIHLPEVLVLHLMRFQFTGKSAKISKYIAFEPRLAMRSSWMATGTPDRGAVYNLVATVTHHGKTITRGHYTADVVQPDGKWLRFDDCDVYWVKEQQVLADTPYLLVYERQR